MRLKALLLGSRGQLAHDLRRAHAELGDASFDLALLPRESPDLAESGAVERVLGGLDFDVLVNCAAHTRVDDSEDDASLAFAVNAHAVRAMARVCATKGARLFHFSTDYVFGGDRARQAPLRERDPMAPVNVYGASKAMGETLARLESDDVVILRVASLFGAAGAGGRGGNFVETIVRAARERRPLRVVDDQTMSPTAAADVARTAMRMLTEGCASGTYHVVNSGSATWHELACEILRRVGLGAGVAALRHRGVPGPGRAPALLRARQCQGLGRVRRPAAMAGRARALPSLTGAHHRAARRVSRRDRGGIPMRRTPVRAV